MLTSTKNEEKWNYYNLGTIYEKSNYLNQNQLLYIVSDERGSMVIVFNVFQF